MSDVLVHSVALMGTVVTIEVVGRGATRADARERQACVDRAVDWFREVERRCTRFDPDSEIRRLAMRTDEPVEVSEIVLEAMRFALALAEETGGAFDPTVGAALESRGFDTDYRSGRVIRTLLDRTERSSYRDIEIDLEQRTITLHRPLVLDLGAVAKGMAVDLAVRELAPFNDFAVDAGGDLFLAGHNAIGAPWSVGIRHPRREHEIIDRLRVSNVAVCTSGDYERRATASGGREEWGHHILDPRVGTPANDAVSVTVVAPTAMVADALGTAAFVLGPAAGIPFLDQHGVDGFIVTPSLERIDTRGMRAHRHAGDDVTVVFKDA